MQNEHVMQQPVVLHFASWYPTKIKPMLGVFIKKHITLLNNDVKQGVIYFNVQENCTTNYNVITHANNELLEIEILINKNSLLKSIYILLGFLKSISVAKKLIGNPNIIHLHAILPLAPLIYFYSLFNKSKIIITEHWTGYQKEDGNYKGFFKKLFTSLIIKRSNAIITVSQQLANAMRDHGLKFKNRIISNYVDIDTFSLQDKNTILNNFIHVSSLDDRQKNVSGIIKAFEKIINKYPDATLTIVGSGGDERMLKELCANININHKINFTGTKTGLELATLIKNSNALIMFSRYENQPVVILEALACGTPIISTFVGGIGEMLDDTNSIKIETENVLQLTNAIESILNNKIIFDSDKIRNNILKTIHPDIIKNKHLELYREELYKNK